MNKSPASKRLTSFWVFLFLIFGSLVIPSQSVAQFTIEIGISRDKAVRAMLSRGYSQINVIRKGFKTVRAEACLNGTKYLVRVDDRYSVSNQQQLGFCRGTVTAEALERNLINSGYERVVIERQNGRFVAIACLEAVRVRITYSSQGEVLQKRNIGQCQEILEPNDIRKILRDAGYNRIKFIDRQLPWYRAEACLKQSKIELLLTRYGQIRRKTPVGKCAPELRPANIAAFLEKKGYYNVRVLDDRLPRYKVAACLNNDRYDLEVGRYGKISNRQVTGQCRNAMTVNQISELLHSEGFTRVRVKKNQYGGFEVTACLDGYQKFASLSRFGELLSERDGKRCQSRNVSNIVKNLQKKGFRDIKMYSIGCQKGRKVRIFYDDIGEEIQREQLGRC